MKKSDSLPVKFNAEERKAYDWLYDCQISSWLVDFVTKKVITQKREFDSLIEYAKHNGMQQC